MKKVEAIISPFQLDEVTEALTRVGIEAMTMSEVKSFNGHDGHVELYRGTRYVIDFHPLIKIELALADDETPTAIDALQQATRTNRGAGAAILVMPLEDAVRIRTGEHGAAVARSTGNPAGVTPALPRLHPSLSSRTA